MEPLGQKLVNVQMSTRSMTPPQKIYNFPTSKNESELAAVIQEEYGDCDDAR